MSIRKNTISNAYWVKASWVMELTGWDKRKMQKAREQKIVVTKKTESGILYDLNSIHPLLIK